MRLGVMVGAGGGPAHRIVDGLGAMARWAEQSQLATIWTPQLPGGFDAFASAYVLGSETSVVEIGTAVLPIQTRHPIAMAQAALSTNAVLGGRFSLGIGVSHDWVIEGMLGLPYQRPVTELDEVLDVLGAAFEGPGPVSFDGELHRISSPIDVGAVDPPSVLVAALGPRALRLAGGKADGTILWMADERSIGEHVTPIITAAAASAGRRAPRVVAGIPVCICAESEVEEAKRRTDQIFTAYGIPPNYQRMLDRGDATRPSDLLAAGDGPAVERRLRSFASAGATDATLHLVPIGSDRDAVRASLDLTKGFVASLGGRV